MKLNIFGKKGTNSDGRNFPIYLSTLVKKDGVEERVQVKFRQDFPGPDLKDCPCVIDVDKKKASLDVRQLRDKETGEFIYDEATGEIKVGRTLWVGPWKMVGPYEDHSLDEYED